MAHITQFSQRFSVRQSLATLGAVLLQWLDDTCNRHARRDQIDALNALTDAQLEARGIKRSDIVAHVYRDRIGM